MEKAKLRKLLELIDELASSSEGSWTDRRTLFLAEADLGQLSSLEEFVSWFPFGSAPSTPNPETPDGRP